jgi:carbon-monoxide dehydrogenase large subunit
LFALMLVRGDTAQRHPDPEIDIALSMNEAENSRIGAGVRRREDDKLLRGKGRYAADIHPDDVLHVVFVRSPMPRCRIVECDIEGALEMEGVVAVYTGDDVKDLGAPRIAKLLELTGEPDFPILARDTVAAVGQPIAAVVAASVNHGLDAVDAVFVDLDEEDAPETQVATFSGAWQHGDIDARFAAADHVVEVAVQHPRLAPSPMEPRAVTVDYDAANDSATIWLSTQTPHRARTELAGILGIDKQRMRVIAPDVGGAFGMKASLYPEEVLSVWAAFSLRRSVKWVATRNEEFLAATHGRGASSNGQLALTADGQFLAIRASVAAPLGHWLPTSAAVPAWNAGRMLPGGYRVDAIDVTSRAQTEDKTAVGIYRGAGRPESICLMERLVDEAAAVTGIDPIDLRLLNLLDDADFPYAAPAGHTLDSGRYREALQRLGDEVGYEALKADRDSRRARGEIVGLGVAFYVEPCGTGWESARVTLNPDGTVLAATGGSSQGHGRETAIAQIVADRLGVPIHQVDVLHGDTGTCPDGIGALASRSTPIGGSAICLACDRIAERVDSLDALTEPVTEEVVYEAPDEAWGYGCYIVTVVIDADTGVLTIESAACMDDAGTIINPLLVKGQVMGGDDDGQLLTGSFTDYAMPRADDVPPLSIHTLATPSPNNILGAKGIGEAGTIGAPAAILNAAMNALRPLGVRDIQMPLTSEKIWRAISTAPQGSES